MSIKRIMRVFPNKRAAFLTRLGNIILIQVVFVFTALAIVIFYPAENETVDSEYVSMRNKLREATSSIDRAADSSYSDIASLVGDKEFRKQLEHSLKINNVVQSYLYAVSGDSKAVRLFELYELTGPFPDEKYAGFESLVDPDIIVNDVGSSEELLIPIIHGGRFFVYYYHAGVVNNMSLVLVAISDHTNLGMGGEQFRYTFLMLFLVAALVSLLTVYLINKRFQQPLERLIRGFEKTVKGELYSLVETDMDNELSKLAEAYNNMSLTLWENNKKMTDYNARLEESNEMLIESQEFLQTLIDSSPVCIISTSPEGEITVFNRKASEVFRIERSKAIGSDVGKLFSQKRHSETAKLVLGDNQAQEVLCRRGDASLFPAYLISAAVHTREGEVWAHLYIVKDISESRNFQEMMVRLDRYYTRGEMAGDIAHEINNFLAILSGNVELMPLLMKKNDNEKIAKKLEVMKNTIDRIAHFTDGLMDLNEGDIRFEPSDLNQLIENVVAFLKPQNRFDHIEIVTNLSTDIPLVELDPGQIQQLLVNLLQNAAEALEERQSDRRIVIESRIVESDSSRRALLKISDNGPGVQNDKEDLVFHKRFTTKRKGHGIGLITCKKIVDTHRANILYEYDNGASFTVTLPIEQNVATVATSSAAEAATPA
ncbi:MAG: ATP-binding protein [Candidatus Zixiibacteriota bacterium]